MTTNTLDMTNPRPWYREFWVWFVIALPATVVVAGLSTAYIAISGADALVVDDFQKVGMVARKVGSQERRAAALNIAATAAFDRESGSITVRLQGNVEPDLLQLGLHHPTLSSMDRTVTLRRDETGLYRGNIGENVAGHWHVRIADETNGWRIKGRLGHDQQMVELDGSL